MYDKEALGAVIIFSCMCLFSWVVFGMSGSASMPEIASAAVMAAIASALICIMLKLLAKKESYSSTKKNFMMALYAVLGGAYYGIPKSSSLYDIANSSDNSQFGKALTAMRKRMLMGNEGPLCDSAPELQSILGRTEIPDSLETSQIRSFIDKSESHLMEKASAIESYSQRYATANMFLSTVLPSFVIFAFIGSSIISAAKPSMLLFSSVLLFALPVLYAAGSSKLNGVLIG